MNAPWRTLIVDDEAPARADLRELLEDRGDVVVVGEAANVKAAEEQWRHLQPDLILLDVQLPRANGFDLLPKLMPMPKVIFVTAYDQFAVRAFEVNAIDYLMKPVTAQRLDQALRKARLSINPVPQAELPFLATDFVAMQIGRNMVMVPVRDLAFVEADGNFTHAHLADGTTYFTSRPIGEWVKRLPQDIFVRLDRSILVNRAQVKKLNVLNRDQGQLIVTGGRDTGIALHRTALARAKELFSRV